MKKVIIAIVILLVIFLAAFFLFHKRTEVEEQPLPLPPGTATSSQTTLTLSTGSTLTLTHPANYDIRIAAQGFKRLRFMNWSPDRRLFVTDLHDVSDNTQGKIYILSNFNEQTGQFQDSSVYASNLRNPNSVTFYEDISGGWWIYIALTDKLIRYPYHSGDMTPQDPPQIIATFPAYGRSAAQGGWHLTRTVTTHNNKIYVSVGSSCNSCEEKELDRASIIEMDPDGSNKVYIARGLRNAVGQKWVGDDLYATDMGADHLGNTVPNDMFYKIQPGTNYGWPYCYVSNGKVYPDTTIVWQKKDFPCGIVPLPEAEFPAHAAPLGLEYFDNSFDDSSLRDSFLVALHGSGNKSIGTGNAIVKVTEAGAVSNFIIGFLENGNRIARPADILKYNNSAFFVTDDLSGTLYFVSLKK